MATETQDIPAANIGYKAPVTSNGGRRLLVAGRDSAYDDTEQISRFLYFEGFVLGTQPFGKRHS